MLEFKFVYGENGCKLAMDMRKEVFAAEFGMSVISDENDGGAYHFVGYDKTVQVAAARLFEIADSCFKIDFTAVKKDYRRQHIGELVMRALADKAVSLGGKSIILEAPIDLMPFFEREGYASYGGEFDKDGRKHTMMKKDLSIIRCCCGCTK